MNRKLFFTISKLAFMVVVPITLLLLPKNFFDHGPSLCLSRVFFHMDCYGCGMTRACMHLIHLDFEEAFAYNAISFIVFPLLCILWTQWFLKEFRLYRRYRQQAVVQS